MKVAFVTSEMTPFCKTGGLADVSGALTSALADKGCEVVALLPRYSVLDEKELPSPLKQISFDVPLGERRLAAEARLCRLKRNLNLVLIGNEDFFSRPGIYGTRSKDFSDNDERFAFFSRAVCEALLRLNVAPDVVHLNEWQTGLVAPYLKSIYEDSLPKPPRIIFTVHNLAYQGLFPFESFIKTGLPPEMFSMEGCEFWGSVSYLKAGIVYSDRITTVSRRYAEEIQSEEFGFGLEGVFQKRRDELFGITNGVDYDVWNPEIDPFIEKKYSAITLADKTANKQALQRKFKLPKVNVPIIGFIGRLVAQKGIDLIINSIPETIKSGGVQFVFLGTGQALFEEALMQLAEKFPKNVGVQTTFDEKLAHITQAGSDFLLMPSRYEPCGLNQMYSLKYGTVPIVRETGGLADVVRDADASPESGNGFSFSEYSAFALCGAIQRAIGVYGDVGRYKSLQLRGMSEDHSWGQRIGEFMKVYS
ncbi:MAG: glycogen synthase GlgA [Myxococcota bacterium]